MSIHVSWILALDIQPGREADFRARMAEMVAGFNPTPVESVAGFSR